MLQEEEISSNSHVIDLILPVLVLIGTAIGAMIYTGFLGGATDIVTAFSGCDAETSLIFATMITVLFMLVLYLPRKVVTFKGFMDSFVEGFKMMIPAIAILIFAWSLKGMGDALEIGTFVKTIVGTREATEYAMANGVLFLPGKASNAGGVATSALEMSQNSQRLSWTAEEVDAKLHQIMKDIYAKIDDAAKRYDMPDNFVAGANIAGFEKVVDAMIAQGLV